MTHIITLLLDPENGQVQVIASEGLDLSATRIVLSVGLSAITEQEIRERIQHEIAEKAAQEAVCVESSEPPVLDGGSPPVGGVDVDLGEVQVAPDHVKAGMPEQVLEGVDVPTVAQIVDRKGVPEAVGVNVPDAGSAS